MEIPCMPLPPMLDAKAADGSIRNDMGHPGTPFKLPQLDLGSIGIGKRSGAKKRAAAAAAALDDDDDEDPREEAQMMQLLQQMQKVKQSKENKRKRGEIAARAKVVAAGVRRHASKRVEEVKSSQDKHAAELRSTMDILRAALEEEARLAPALLEEQQKAMKEAVDALTAKYDEAAKVQAQVKLLGECMRQHLQVVRSHVAAQLDSRITETEEVVQAIHNQPDRMLSLINSAGGLA